MLLYQNLAYTIHEKISKGSSKNNKFKILTPIWNDKFEFPDESFSVSHIPHYSEYIIKNMNKSTDNPPIKIYINKIENMITY